MKAIKKLSLISIAIFCILSVNSAFAADMSTISGTVTDMSTYPNMIVVDQNGVSTEIYGIKFSYLENQYNIVIEPGMDISAEVYENLCYDGTIRLKAASITVDDATIDLETTGAKGRRNRIE